MKMQIMRFGALAAVIAVFAALAASSGQQSAQANPLTVRMFNPSICLAVGGLSTPIIQGCTQEGGNAMRWTDFSRAENLHGVAQALRGDTFGPPVQPSDFDGVDELSGRQIHQLGGDPTVHGATVAANNLAKLVVVAFVDSDAPVEFRTTAGRWMENNQQVWLCSRPDPPGGAGVDPDCGGGSQAATQTEPTRREDGAVVATLSCRATTCPNRGTERIDIIQNNIVFPVEFTVVGEAHSIEFFTLEDTMQAGVPDDPDTGQPACPFQADVGFITASLAQAEKTVIVARALDIDKNQITGAWFDWITDPDFMVAAQPFTPTLNLGAFGFGAPNILCVPRDAKTGESDLTVRMKRRVSGLAPGVDAMAAWWIPWLVDGQAGPAADPRMPTKSVTYTILGLPEQLELSVDPPNIVCDGDNTATVTAQVRDADGNAATDGVDVRFDVEILGVADPITTRTNGEGVASSTVRPISDEIAGTTVLVTVPSTGVQENILVGCVLGVAEPPDPTAPPVDEPVGITPPATGEGIFGDSSGALSWWPALALLAGAIGLGGARLAMRRA
jgi:hypothetical protein